MASDDDDDDGFFDRDSSSSEEEGSDGEGAAAGDDADEDEEDEEDEGSGEAKFQRELQARLMLVTDKKERKRIIADMKAKAAREAARQQEDDDEDAVETQLQQEQRMRRTRAAQLQSAGSNVIELGDDSDEEDDLIVVDTQPPPKEKPKKRGIQIEDLIADARKENKRGKPICVDDDDIKDMMESIGQVGARAQKIKATTMEPTADDLPTIGPVGRAVTISFAIEKPPTASSSSVPTTSGFQQYAGTPVHITVDNGSPRTLLDFLTEEVRPKLQSRAQPIAASVQGKPLVLTDPISTLNLQHKALVLLQTAAEPQSASGGGEAAGGGPKVRLKFQSQNKEHINVGVSLNEPLEKTLAKVCEKLGKSRGECRFCFEGDILKGTETPADLDMEAEDDDPQVIDIIFR